jgi:hypothetical protein
MRIASEYLMSNSKLEALSITIILTINEVHQCAHKLTFHKHPLPLYWLLGSCQECMFLQTRHKSFRKKQVVQIAAVFAVSSGNISFFYIE